MINNNTKIFTHRNQWALITLLYCLFLSCSQACWSQDDDQLLPDTFNNNYQPQLAIPPGSIEYVAPAQTEIFGIPDPDLGKMNAKLVADVNPFRNSLPSDPPSLIRRLKKLLKLRIDQWDIRWSPWDMEYWIQYCQAILWKL